MQVIEWPAGEPAPEKILGKYAVPRRDGKPGLELVELEELERRRELERVGIRLGVPFLPTATT